ncbi:hypothetical protein L198_04919 [Cryptococcus wingfieldii CBS 7118]|uniref:Asl1-like glycosyl hydrolase catalytic domain-containing protein n=1 Tax=Cryptococcus wingfieldii CBS 7118 TaxID=1295528 RepID=A0A1E3J282_9TREE|nr:hypothetical protein L198_04919 [Cryptococcus wingfieldii CBS 7118]ODN94775.1 hypothetical protein L198_04919 [Cryptococcus wingfieldii CBS 7118]
MQLHALLAILPYLVYVSAAPAPAIAKRDCPAKGSASAIAAIDTLALGSATSSISSEATASTASASGIDLAVIGGGQSRSGGRPSWGVSANAALVETSAANATLIGTSVVEVAVTTTSEAAVETSPTIDISSIASPINTAISSALDASSSILSSEAVQTIIASTTPITTTSLEPATISSTQAAATTSAAATVGDSSIAVGFGVDSTGWQGLSGVAGLEWYWNWGLVSFDLPDSQFVPCVWGSEMADAFDQATIDAFPSGTSHIMSFNEPDQTIAVGGSDITEDEAATLHQAWTAQLGASSLKVGAPAVARGGTTWCNNWLTACGGHCEYDFVPIHFYGIDPQELIDYVTSFPADGKPIWVTEMACRDFSTGYICTADEVSIFINTAVTWFRGEGAQYVERWAWFGAMPKYADDPNGMENADGTTNELGTTYLAL